MGDGTAATRRTLIVNGGANAGIGAYLGVQIGGSLVGTLASSGWAAGDTSTDLAVYADTGKSIRFYSAGAENMRLTSTGLGIGTTNPTYKLDVVGTAQISSTLGVGGDAVIGSSTSSGYAVFSLISSTTGSARYGSIRKNYDSPFDLRIRASNSAVAAPLVFDLSNSTEAARFDTSGNLGIGTTSPGSLYSGANNLVVGGGSGSTGMTVYSGTTGTGRLFFADGTVGADAYRGWVEYGHTSNNLTLGTDGATRVTIDSSGNVGIGTGSPDVRLQVTHDNAETSQFNVGASILHLGS